MDGRRRSLNMSAIVISVHMAADNCFGNYDDNGDNEKAEWSRRRSQRIVRQLDKDATGIQSTHGRPPFTLPATLPVTRIFSHYPTRTLPEVKKPYPSQPALGGSSSLCSRDA